MCCVVLFTESESLELNIQVLNLFLLLKLETSLPSL